MIIHEIIPIDPILVLTFIIILDELLTFVGIGLWHTCWVQGIHLIPCRANQLACFLKGYNATITVRHSVIGISIHHTTCISSSLQSNLIKVCLPRNCSNFRSDWAVSRSKCNIYSLRNYVVQEIITCHQTRFSISSIWELFLFLQPLGVDYWRPYTFSSFLAVGEAEKDAKSSFS